MKHIYMLCVSEAGQRRWQPFEVGNNFRAGVGHINIAAYQGLNVLPLVLLSILLYMFYQRGGLKVIEKRLGKNSTCSSGQKLALIWVGRKVLKELREALDFIKLTAKPKPWVLGL